MGIKCIICNVRYTSNSEKKFHSFPKNELRKLQWKKACKLSLCLPTSKICSDHFSPEDYELSGLLKKDAVPCEKNGLIKSVAMTTPENKPEEYPVVIQSPMSDICVTPRKHDSNNVELLSSVQSNEYNTVRISMSEIWVTPRKHDSNDVELLPSVQPDEYNTVRIHSPMSEIRVTPRKHDSNDVELLSPVQLTPRVMRPKQWNADSIGILSPSHFSSPQLTKINIKMIKDKYKQIQIHNHYLQEQIRRLNSKLKTYDDILCASKRRF